MKNSTLLDTRGEKLNAKKFGCELRGRKIRDVNQNRIEEKTRGAHLLRDERNQSEREDFLEMRHDDEERATNFEWKVQKVE